MQRIRSGSSIGEGGSSVVTGDSTQMAIEGQWDETVSLEQIHDGIVEHLTAKLEKLKAVYKGLKMKARDKNREELLMKKIVHARLNYQRYIAATKDILSRCGEFIRTQRDTPETRIAFIRNAQEYFTQARDFIKLDITFRKISPTLLKYVEPGSSDPPEVYARKRELCRTMMSILGKERVSQLTNGAGKTFRSKYIQQSKLFGKGFPMHWFSYLPPILKDVLQGSQEEVRWPKLIIFLLSGYSSRNFIHQGFCPGCYFPILRQIVETEISGGKLFCHACGKEIEWTYNMNPRSLRVLFSGFHPKEILDMKENVYSRIREEGEDLHEEENALENILKICVHSEEKVEFEETNGQDCESSGDDAMSRQPKKRSSPGGGRGRPRSESPDSKSPEQEFKIVSFKDILEKVREFLCKTYKEETSRLDQRLKDVYQAFKTEIQNFEGLIEEVKYPRGFLSKIDKYVRHYFKVPSKEEVQSLPLNEKGAKDGTHRGMVIAALASLDHANLLDQTSLICEKLWGYSLPDLSEHRDQILYECVLQREIFSRLSPNFGRKSNIHQQLIFMLVIQRYGYRWTEEDFRISFSDSTRKKQMDIMREIFQIIDR